MPDFAESLHGLSNHWSAIGQREAALKTIEEALTIRRRLAAVRPNIFLPDLAVSLGACGNIYAILSQPPLLTVFPTAFTL